MTSACLYFWNSAAKVLLFIQREGTFTSPYFNRLLFFAKHVRFASLIAEKHLL